MDFQLKALGHWSHLYSLSSVWITMCCSRLGKRDRLSSHGRRQPGPAANGAQIRAPTRTGLFQPRHILLQNSCPDSGRFEGEKGDRRRRWRNRLRARGVWGGFAELTAAVERDCKSLCEKEASSTSSTGGAATREHHFFFWHLFHRWKLPYSASKCRCVLQYFLLNT